LDFGIRFASVEQGAFVNRMAIHRLSFLNTSWKFLATGLLVSLWGCGEDAPPYESLPLRDALRAAPEVVATLSDEARHELALRLREAEQVDPETLTFKPEILSLEPLVSSADDVRENTGKDALVFGEILATDGHGLLEIHASADFDTENASLIDVQGKANDVAAPFEEAALRGQAGKTLRGFVARTHAKSVVRMTGLPVAAVAWNDKVYVNESWLVALSALEDACVVGPVPEKPIETGAIPGTKPLSVDFNPFDLPGTLNECLVQVQETCACGKTMSCSHVPTDQTFADSNAECTWVNQDAANASAICILALLSLDNVKECVDSASPVCAYMPVRNRDGAVLFATDAHCVSILNSCLKDGEPQAAPATASSSSCGDSCEYCDGKGNDCEQCATDCATSAPIWEACLKICDACLSSADRKTIAENEAAFKFATVQPINQCSVRPATEKSPIPKPLGAALWLFAPVAYLLSRSRRRM
jgi:hypothetical protein